MKVLVVDDDAVARKVLGAFLKQSNYEMQIVEDGRSAFQALTVPDAPLIGIIDWVMPDLTGPELCVKLRQHPFEVQPYLLMLSGRKEKTDIITALDSGADDFISKPFNIQEMQARLRVAVRNVEQQLELRKQIAALKDELLTTQSAAMPPGKAAEPGDPVTGERRLAVEMIEDYQIETILAGALRHSGQSYSPLRTATAPRGTQIVAWAGLLLTKDECWVDLFLELEASNLKTLIAQSRTASGDGPEATRRFCLGLHTALRDSMRSVLRAMGSEAFAPLPARAFSSRDGLRPPFPDAPLHRHHYNVGDATLTFSYVSQPCPLREKTTNQLQMLDVLARPYPPADTHHVPLFRDGVVLTEQFIEKLQQFTQATSVEVPPIFVHSPSALAAHHYRRS